MKTTMSKDIDKLINGGEYDFDFSSGYCQNCNRYGLIGNWKTRNPDTEVITDWWLCSKCGGKLERKIRTWWKKYLLQTKKTQQ